MILGDKDHLSSDDMLAIFRKKNETIKCSWAVFTMRNRTSGIVELVLMFFDEETRGDKFTYAFNISPGREILLLCERLLGADKQARLMIEGKA